MQIFNEDTTDHLHVEAATEHADPVLELEAVAEAGEAASEAGEAASEAGEASQLKDADGASQESSNSTGH